MQFATRPALAALLMATGALSKACGKNKLQMPPTTMSTSVVSASSSSTLVYAETSATLIQSTSTLSASSVYITPSSAAYSSSAAATTLVSSSAVATTASSSSAAASATASSSSSLTSDEDEALEVHNSARSDEGESALVWDDTLASNALAWAQTLAQSGSAGTLTHSSGTGEGENLYWQSDSGTPYTNAANSWVDEKSSYNGEAITGSGNFEEYGHYSM